MLRRLCLSLLVAVAASAARGQEYTFRHYGPDAGLPIPGSLAFDTDGTLLIGTTRGLYRFDGRAFERLWAHTGFGSVGVLPSRHYGAWIQWGDVRGYHLDAWRQGVRTVVPRQVSDAMFLRAWIPRTIEAPDGALWMNVAEGGGAPARLWRFEPGPGRWTSYALTGVPFPTAPVFTPDGVLWLSDRQRVGRVVLEGARARVVWTDHAFPRVIHLRPHPAGGLWVMTRQGLFRLLPSGAVRTILPPPHDVSWHSLTSVDGQGRLLYFASDGDRFGVYRVTPGGRVDLRLDDRTGLRTSIVRGLLPDDEGGLFIAHDLGLSYLDGEGIVAYPVREGDQQLIVRDVLGRGGAPFVTTWDGMYRVVGARVVRVSPPGRRGAGHAYFSPGGALHWLEFSDFGGGEVFRLFAGRLDAVRAGPFEVYADDAVRLSGRDTVLMLQRRRPDGGWGPATTLPRAVDMEARPVRAAGLLWMRSGNGLDALAGDSLASLCRRCVAPDLARALAWARRLPTLERLVADPEGRVWFVAGTRLAVLWRDAAARWHGRLLAPDELPGSRVTDVVPRATGHLWVATDAGLHFVQVAKGVPRLQVQRELRTYGELAGDVVSAVYEDTLGHVWMGLRPGFVHRLTLARLDRLGSPGVVVTQLEADGQPRTPGRVLRVPADRARLLVGLRPASYRGSGQIELEYRLAPEDTAWIRMGMLRTIRSTSLPPGQHTLEVRALRAGSTPGPVLRLPIVAVPPWWRRPWLVPFFALLLAVPLVLVYRARAARRLALERLRLRIATDLHDDLGSGLTQVALYSDLIHQRTEAPVSEWALTVGETARATLDGLRDIVWSINPAQESPAALLLRLKDHANGLFTPQGIPFTFEGEEAEGGPALPLDVRRNVLLIGKEGLHNAARHAGATGVRVRWARAAGRLSLTIEDDGRGFDVDVASSGNGVSSMRRRAEEIGATLDIDAAPGQGTRLHLVVPL